MIRFARRHIFVSTFIVVFVAELGDKTQIAAFSLAAKHGDLLSVSIGAALALICSSLLAVLFGHRLANVLPERVLRIASGVVFVGTGVWLAISTFLG
jgi:putative Ca2+/H+ antiporter (TMEM165/GDT1 family)